MPPEVTVPTPVSRRVDQVEGEADQLVLHRQQAREGGRVQAVGAGVRRHRLAAERVDLRHPRVVDVGQRPAAVDRQVPRLSFAEPREHLAASVMAAVAGRVVVTRLTG